MLIELILLGFIPLYIYKDYLEIIKTILDYIHPTGNEGL